MTIDFYYLETSAPCRSVMLTAAAVGVSINKKPLNLMAGEHLKPEFLAINPQHCIPTLVDGDLKLWESRAICTYLINQYGKDSNLIPKDAKQKAMVERLLYFDMGTLYQRFADYAYPVMFMNKEKADPEGLKKIQEALGWLNTYLDGHEYAVGDSITVADFVLVASVSSFKEGGIDLSDHPNVEGWLDRCSGNLVDYDGCNGEGAKKFGQFVKSKLG